jgi:hypothetical protein
MKFKQYPSQSELKQLFNYNPDTGIFTHKTNRGGVKIGSKSGSPTYKTGYIQISILNKVCLAHRLAWIYMYGEIPIGFQIDHINNIRSDNRITNLRLATSSQNHQNQKLSTRNTSGVKGVYWYKTRQRWKAELELNGKSYYLGLFAEHDKASAIAAVMQAREAMHGEFTNHGELHLARPIPTPTLF